VTDHDAVLRAAADLVSAFGSHQTDQYFAAFAPDASMMFHNVERLFPAQR
jgi:hypothetical protein